MKNKQLVLLSFLLQFAYSGALFAQVPTGANSGIMGYFQIGNSGMDLSGLNTPLQNAGYGSMPENFLTLGGGGHIFYKRLVLGGEGSSFIVNIASNENTNTSARLSGGHGFGNIGYMAYNGLRWKIYPMLGIGAGKYKLEIVQNQGQNLNSLLSKPQNLPDEKMETGGFLLNLSLNISTALKASGDKGTAGPIIIGIRGGYILQPSMNPWTYDFGNVPSSSMCMQGWYAMLQIGFGFWSKPASVNNSLPNMPLPE